MDISELGSNQEEYSLISSSGFFDEDYYHTMYDLDEKDDAIVHFLKIGVYKNYNPSDSFSTDFYLKRYPDVKKSGMNPLVHYIKYGVNEGRIPKFLSDSEIIELNITSPYMADNYLRILYSGLFDEKYYCNKYHLTNDMNPIVHYLKFGSSKGYNPSPSFDVNYYLENNPQAKDSGIDPFVFFIMQESWDFSLTKNNTIHELLDMDLKLSLRGKNGFFFLINDGNCELRQHFDVNYKNRFDSVTFISDYYFKNNLFNDFGIDYFFFNIPDKSIICKNLLPFDVDVIKRNINLVPQIVDFSEYLNHTHFYKWDTHMNFKAGELLSFKFLNHVDNNLSIGEWNTVIEDNFEEFEKIPSSDLISQKNWSYGPQEQIFLNKRAHNIKDVVIKPKKLLSKKIWDEFKVCGNRESFYFKNPNSISDKTALIFRDSTFDYLKWYFLFYFKEIFFYWDHGTVDSKLINLVKPDVIIEARVERFLEGLMRSDWVKNKINIFTD